MKVFVKKNSYMCFIEKERYKQQPMWIAYIYLQKILRPVHFSHNRMLKEFHWKYSNVLISCKLIVLDKLSYIDSPQIISVRWSGQWSAAVTRNLLCSRWYRFFQPGRGLLWEERRILVWKLIRGHLQEDLKWEQDKSLGWMILRARRDNWYM